MMLRHSKFDIVNFEYPNSKCGLAYLAVLGYSGSGVKMSQNESTISRPIR